MQPNYIKVHTNRGVISFEEAVNRLQRQGKPLNTGFLQKVYLEDDEGHKVAAHATHYEFRDWVDNSIIKSLGN